MLYHPFLVHFPIALLLAGVVFDLAARLARRAALAEAAYWCLAAGVLGGVAAAAAGLRDADLARARLLARLGAEQAAPQLAAIARHQTVALIVLGIFVALFLWRAAKGDAVARHPAYLAAGLAGVALLLYGGYLGGRLAHPPRVPAPPPAAAAAAPVTVSPAGVAAGEEEDGYCG